MTLHDGVMTFKSLQLTPFCIEKFRVRKGIVYVLAAFSVRICLEYGQICKNNDHGIIICQFPREMFERP